MKSFISLLFLFWSAACFSQNIRIPDLNFKKQLISLGFDTNDDGQIQVGEAANIKKLYINDLGIVNLEGIHSFVNLEELGCYNNKITSLDLSSLTKLKYLFAKNNRIIFVDLSNATELLDLSLEGNFFIKELDLSRFKKLKSLNFSDNQVAQLDVTGLSQLEFINGNNNQLVSISIKGLSSLKTLLLKNNPLQPTIDIRGLTRLEYLDCTGCNLLYLNFSGTVHLKNYYW